eukprot:TRINITY_DN2603_c0_g1_i1.p1 TRINITY_DN2603_c0_g1~~TRINITY_DN2603_c0_g1_i1.p1  ORF type:complete len:295 (-),score=47.51 TRINITY_DN2603_c0_g1_i1:75-959(-)
MAIHRPQYVPRHSPQAAATPVCLGEATTVADEVFCDAHCHLHSVAGGSRAPAAVAAARAAGVYGRAAFVVNVCYDADDVPTCRAILAANKPFIYATFGIHPHKASTYCDRVERQIVECMPLEGTVGWGECGLDFFKNFSPKEVQIPVFARQMRRAVESKKTLVVHTRSADEDTVRLMTEALPSDYPIHLHCYTGGPAFARDMLTRFSNLSIGFTGVITFGSAGQIRDSVRVVPIERLLLETDGPFMAPNPFRGQKAHPGHIPYIAAEVSKVKGIPQRDVMKISLANTKRLYSIP